MLGIKFFRGKTAKLLSVNSHYTIAMTLKIPIMTGVTLLTLAHDAYLPLAGDVSSAGIRLTQITQESVPVSNKF